MNRVIIGFTVLVTVIMGGVAFYLNCTSWKPFRCNTHASSHILSMDGRKLELNLDISIVSDHEGGNEWLAVGSLKGFDKDYAISRRMFISIKDSDFKDFTKAMIIREERHSIDNIPDEIWQKYILPEAPGVTFYMETKRLSHNLILVKGLTNPFFVCAIIEH